MKSDRSRGKSAIGQAPSGIRNKSQRLSAIEDLLQHDKPENTIDLIRFLDDSSWEVREKAARGLVHLGDPFARITARLLLSDPEWTLRSTGAELLGRFGQKADAVRLIRLRQDPEWVVRASVAGSLGQLGGNAAEKALTQMLSDHHPNVRSYAAVALADLGVEEALPLIEARLQEETNSLARAGLFRAAYGLGLHDRLEPLLAMLDDPDSQLRCQILDGLRQGIRSADRDHVASVVRSLLDTEQHAAVRDYAVGLLDHLGAMQGSPRSVQVADNLE